MSVLEKYIDRTYIKYLFRYFYKKSIYQGLKKINVPIFKKFKVLEKS